MRKVTDYLKFFFISYFSKHICPDRFSLSNEEAKRNDFYEVHIYVPEASNEEAAKIPKKFRGALKVKCEFMPLKDAARWGWILSGKKKERQELTFNQSLLSCEYLRYSRIDVNYYFGYWNIREKDCSLYKLFILFLMRAFRGIYLSILKQKLTSFYRKRMAIKRLGSPLKSKFEIYEALMNDDEFLKTGTFKKDSLLSALFGKHYMGEYSVYRKVSRSLEWILDACLDDNEIEIISVPNAPDPLYKMKGKGVHYFTLTKESIKNDEAATRIQDQQIKIQRRMFWLTAFLVVGTFLSAWDKVPLLKEFFISLMDILSLLVESRWMG